ncbi:kinesin-like protein KIN-14C [Tanacetum coccineum]
MTGRNWVPAAVTCGLIVGGLSQSGKADDGSLEMDRNIGSRRMSPGRQVLSPMNMQIGSSETEEGLKTYTKQEVVMLLKDRFKGKKFDDKGKQEWTIEYIKRLKVCLKWLQDVVDEKDGLQTALKSKEDEFVVTVSKLETNILSLNESLAKEESEKLAALDCLKKEKEANMALEKNQESLRKELGWAEQTALNANEKVKMQEHMYASLQEHKSDLQKNNTHLQDQLREANRANKQVESEKAAILQELSTLRAHTPFLQLQDELREANRANKQLESEKASILQELITLRAHNTFLQLQDELRVVNRANKQLESEKAAILQELSNSRAHNTFHAQLTKPDPFSLLQEDILLDIMSRIECTTKELIRTTSTISKRWQNLWASVHHLIFLEEEDDVDPDTNIHGYISFIDNTINQCPTYPNLKLFILYTNYNSLHNPEFKSRVNSWIRYAISRNVEEFNLRFWDLGGEGELESLCISCGTLDEDMLEKILSGSPCLETLELEDCYGYRRINITSKSVKEFVFSGYNSHHGIYIDEDYIDCVKINAPYISSLTIEGELVLRELALLNVSSLVEAALDYSIDWSGISHEVIFRGLLESLNHAEDITFGHHFSELLSRLEASSDTSNDDRVENGDQEEESVGVPSYSYLISQCNERAKRTSFLACGLLTVPFAIVLQKCYLQFMSAQDKRLRSTSEILNSFKNKELGCICDELENELSSRCSVCRCSVYEEEKKVIEWIWNTSKKEGGGCNMEDPDGTLASVAQCIEQLQQISLSAQDNEYNLKQLLELIDTRRNAFTAVGSHSQAVPVLVSLLRSGSLGVKMQAATVFSKRVIALIFEMNVVFDVSAKSKVPFYSI